MTLDSAARDHPQAMRGLLKGGMVRNILMLASGSGIAQVIALGFAPVLTRLYTPDAFGTLGVFMALGGILAIIGTLRLDVALVLPKSDTDAWGLARVAGCYVVIVTFLTALIFIPFRDPIAHALGNSELAPYLLFLPLLVLLAAFSSIAHYWSVRGKCFKGMSGAAVGSTMFGNGLKTTFGAAGFGVSGLIGGSILQTGVHLGLLGAVIRKSQLIPLESNNRLSGLVRKYSDFPKYRLPQDVLAAAAFNLPSLLLAVFFSPSVVGYFVLAQRIIQTPLSLVRGAVRSVFYQNASELAESFDELFRRTRNLTLALALIALPFLGIIVVSGDVLFTTFFGSEWATAGRYAKYISVLVFAAVCNTPSVVIIPIIGANRGLLLYEILATSSRIGSIIFGGLLLSAERTVMLFCLVSAFANTCLIIWVFWHLHKNVGKNDTNEAPS